jgi:hypothetical protein
MYPVFTHTRGTPKASPQEITCTHCIIVPLLYIGHDVDPTIIFQLRSLASQLSTTTSTTLGSISQLLEYYNINPEVTLRYYASAMQLLFESSKSNIVVATVPTM